MTAGEEEILVDIQQGKTPANINQKGGGTRLVQIWDVMAEYWKPVLAL